MHKILFLGPQGSGKGTQANRLAEKLEIPALSMGQLLRDEKAAGSELGKTIAEIIDAGNLVPDEITTSVLKKRLAQPDIENGFIIDSFPRYMEQYENSKDFFQPTAVIVLDIPQDESMERLVKRAEIEGRADDTPEKIEHRLNLYKQETEPVIQQYKELGVAHVIDGRGTIEEVEARINEALGI